MTTQPVTDATLLELLSKLEPGGNVDDSLRKLLLAKARSGLVKYRLLDQEFHREYGTDFVSFKSSERMKQPSSRVEQDYFDWELAVTMIDELENVLRILQETPA